MWKISPVYRSRSASSQFPDRSCQAMSLIQRFYVSEERTAMAYNETAQAVLHGCNLRGVFLFERPLMGHPQHVSMQRPRFTHPRHKLRVVLVLIICVGVHKNAGDAHQSWTTTYRWDIRAWAAMNREPRKQRACLMRRESVYLKHGGRMWSCKRVDLQ